MIRPAGVAPYVQMKKRKKGTEGVHRQKKKERNEKREERRSHRIEEGGERGEEKNTMEREPHPLHTQGRARPNRLRDIGPPRIKLIEKGKTENVDEADVWKRED